MEHGSTAARGKQRQATSNTCVAPAALAPFSFPAVFAPTSFPSV